MTRSGPAVSVLMVVHNGGAFLAPAVRSVLAQEWRDLELVLVDNGSDDGAVEALLSAGHDPRLVAWREPANRGIAAGTNAAMARARGRWIAVMDQDDCSLPTRLARQVAWLEAHPTAGGVASRTALIDGSGRETGGDFTLPGPEEYRVFTAYSQSANFGSHLFCREVLEAFPRREEFPFSSDFDFIARVVERWPVAVLPEVLFHYRVHQGQATRRHRGEQLAAEVAIRILAALRRAGRDETFDRVGAWLAELAAAGAPAAIHGTGAELCLDLGLAVPAAYEARHLVSADRSAAGLARGAALCFRAMRLDRRTAAVCARLFLTGPLRTHRLHPWPPR